MKKKMNSSEDNDENMEASDDNEERMKVRPTKKVNSCDIN